MSRAARSRRWRFGRSRAAALVLALMAASCAPRLAIAPPASPADAPRLGPTGVPITMRVGIPSGARRNLVVPCDAGTVRRLTGCEGAELVGEKEWRIPCGWDASQLAPGPDTLRVRAFLDAADEEIAFERGEIDVAVFWPGELSAHLRADPRGRDAFFGMRSHGVIAAVETAGGAPDTSGAAARDPRWRLLNEQLFGGDLLAWPAAASADSSATSTARARFVDASLVGRKVIENWLGRGSTPGATAARSRLVYLDAATSPNDSLASAWRAEGLQPLYAVRCPVLVSPAQRLLVQQFGPDRLANLAGCRSER